MAATHPSNDSLVGLGGELTLLNASPVGMVVFDHREMVLYANPRAEALFGKKLTAPGKIRCGDFIGCVHRHAAPQGCGNTASCPSCPLYCAIRSVLTTTDPPPHTQSVEARLERESPEGPLWITFRTTPFTRNGRRHVIMSMEDITHRKRNEQQLRDALAELTVIHENAPVAMMILDRERRVRKVNGFAATFAGRPAAEMIGLLGGEALRCLHHLDDPRGCGFGPHCSECHVRQAVLETFASGKNQRDIEAWLPFPEGDRIRERCLLISTANLQIGDSARVLVCAQDISERKRAEAVLRESEEKFRLAFDASPDAVNINRLKDGLYVNVNDGFTQLTGFTREDVDGRTSMDIDIWHDHADRLKMVRALQETGLCDNLEARFRRKDGSLTTALMSARTIALNGEPHIISVTRDISERKQHESERDITLHLLQFLHKENDLSGLIRDVTALMQSWSGCAAVGIRLQEGEDFPYFETSGFTAEFVEAEKRLCAVDGEGRLIRDAAGNPVLECMCGNVIEGRFDPALPFFTANGSFWTNSTTDLLAATSEADRQARTRNRCHGEGYESVALIPLRLGHRRIGLLQFNDRARNRFDTRKIALFERLASNLAIGLSQRLTALALKESEEKYRSILEAMDDAVYICSPGFRIEYMNQPMMARVGRDATGEFCHKALYGFDHKCPRCVHEKVIEGESVTTEVVNPEDGRTYNVSNSPIFHTDGSVSKLTIFREVTEIKEMEARVQKAQKMEAIGSLAGGIAHDFNNLLFPITGLTEMLMEDLPPESLLHENAREIYTAARRAGDLVKQILSFSRQVEHRKTPVKIQSILREVLKLTRATIPADIEIIQDFEPDCGLVYADPTQIHQIAMNLITNAFHAVEKDSGTIRVHLAEARIEKEDPELRSLNPGRYAVLSVSDTGCGIEPEVMPKIFDPYFTTKEMGKGTGLGLAVVYGIVKEHRGDVFVFSDLGEGTTFRIFLPLWEESSETGPIRPAETRQTGSERILLVDDEPAIVRLETQMLERLGYHVTPFSSSLQALEAFQAKPDAFDLVITDMTMPHLTGDRLASALFAVRPAIPVILCTGFSERVNRFRSEAMGISGFLMKPVLRSELAVTVRKVLDDVKGCC